MQHSEPVLSSSPDKPFFVKEQITMKKRKTNQFISILLALVLLLCSVVPAYAVEGGEPDQIESQDLFITDEVAKHIALLFLEDMVNTGLTTWDESTELVRVVPMYDETGENISAYTAELTSGYIVISSYADVPNLIFEWADEAEPVYAGLPAAHNARSAAKIIYVGPVDYYLDSGSDTLTGIEGEQVPRDALSNDFDEYRDIENVSPEALEMLTEAKREALENGGIAPLAADNTLGGYITDSAAYAKNVYGGSWKCTSWKNDWESAAHFATTYDFPGYTFHCGLVAITNAIKMFGKKYNSRIIQNSSDLEIFLKVFAINSATWNEYYDPGGGTYDDCAGEFIDKSFEAYTVSPTIKAYGQYPCSIDRIKSSIAPNKLMYIMLQNYNSGGKPYENHHLIGYAWACLNNSYQGNKYFIKACDGHNTSARNLDASRLIMDKYWEIRF